MGKNKTMTIWAHRGGANNFEDNSLKAIMDSLKSDCSGIEIDVWLHNDELVLSHSEPSSADLPLLDDALKLVNGKLQIYLEIKHPEAATAAFRLIENKYKKHSNTVVFASFDAKVLRAIRNKSSAARLGLNYRGVDNHFIDIAEELSVEFVTFNWARIFPNLFNIKQAHSVIDTKYLAYTVNSPTLARLLFKLGIDGVVTDWPDKFSRY